MAKIKRQDLTQELLKEYLEYSPISGYFTYLKKTGKKSVVGSNVGSISKRDGHLEIRFFGELYRASRLAWFYMTGVWGLHIDHEDHNELNNAWTNLRSVTQKVNNMNMSTKSTNTSGVTGVWWHKKNKRWIAEIMIDGVKHSLGCFVELIEAATARKQAEAKFGFHKNHGLPK